MDESKEHKYKQVSDVEGLQYLQEIKLHQLWNSYLQQKENEFKEQLALQRYVYVNECIYV